jgi:hypothetical protein
LNGAFVPPISTTVPAYPPQTRSGGAVLALLRVAGGVVARVEILEGDSAFTGATRSALRLWRFPAAMPNAAVPVVVVFASPHLLASEPPGVHIFAARAPGLVLPRRVTEPTYPVHGSGGGAALVLLSFGPEGEVARAAPVDAGGAFSEAVLQAARDWQFTPGGAGMQLLALGVFRPPVLPVPQAR